MDDKGGRVMARGRHRNHSRPERDDFDDYAASDATGAYRGRDDRHGGGDERYTGEYDSRAYDAMDESAEWDAVSGRALVPLDSSYDLMAVDDGMTGPVIIPGTGASMGRGFLPARERSMTMRLAVIGLTALVVLSGLFAVVPLGGDTAGAQGATPFEALAGAVVLHATPDFFWYMVKQGDTLDSVANHFNVQIGGVLELNGMLAGEELQVGKNYKVPSDPAYGAFYRPPSFVVATASGNGATTYGDSPWTSNAGIPPLGALCGPVPSGSGDNIANYNLDTFQLYAPNPGAYWVRGFTWYHNGVDLSNPMGTPLHASQAGEVIFSGWDPGGGGWAVKINNCNHISTFYAHMETLLVKVHDEVHAGQVIGLEGSTGWSTGPHCHFTVEWDNNPVDPMAFFQYNIFTITHHTAPGS
jgi:murein DD-endopeptidase MepM/ murein hydrolase activator NlpD